MTAQAFQIPFPPQYRPDECLHWLDRGYDEVLYELSPGGILRAVELAGKAFVLDLRVASGHWELYSSPEPGPEHYKAILHYLQDWLDLGTDPAAFYALLEQSPRLHYLLAHKGLPLVGIPDLFEALCWSILGQQINLRFAYQLKRRLVEHLGTPVAHEGKTLWLFPRPKQVLEADPEDLRAMKISHSKIAYLQVIAAAMQDGSLSKAQLAALPTFAERQKMLIAHKGIGIWTANYVLMKCLRAQEAIPWGDAGLNQALIREGIMQDRNDLAAAKALFADFKGWESYLVLYLWRSLPEKK